MLGKLVNVPTSADRPRQATDLCNLPLQFIEKEGLSLGTKVVIHIHRSLSSSGVDDVQYTDLSYYKWSGDISRRFPDCIEIQSPDMELETIKMVRASVVHPIPRVAMEVHVTPSTLYDWGKYSIHYLYLDITFQLFIYVSSVNSILTSTQ